MARGACVVLVCVGLIIASLTLARPADAYRIGGRPWPGHVVTYHDGSPYHAAVLAAVRAWNGSGARIRLVPAPSRSAKLHITATKLRFAAGVGTLGFVPPSVVTRSPETVRPIRVRGNHIFLDTGIFRAVNPGYPPPLLRIVQARIVAHEIGHVLGLAHETRGCATMSPTGDSPSCSKPPQPWDARCRLLEPDDVRGAIRRYGGRAKPPAPAFCDIAPALPAPTGVTAGVDPVTGVVTVRWRNIASDRLTRVVLTSRRGRCPATLDPEADPIWVSTETAPRSSWSDRGDARATGPGPYCYALWSYNDYNRPSGRPATITVETPPAPSPPPRPPEEDPPPRFDPPEPEPEEPAPDEPAPEDPADPLVP